VPRAPFESIELQQFSKGVGVDTAGKTHGFFGTLNLFQQYDLKGAASSLPRGLNDNGAITGSFADAKGMQHGFVTQLCARDASASVAVTQGPISLDSATGEYVQTVKLKNTGTSPITGPLYLLFNTLTQGVFLADKGSGISSCIAPQTPFLRVNLSARPSPPAPPANLRPGASVSVKVFYANILGGPISYSPIVRAGAQLP
jgi:hypothetical protein